MSKINLTVSETIAKGKQISFKAPCDSKNAESLVINDVEYDIVDAVGDSVLKTFGIWAKDAIISVILNTDAKKAFIQNPKLTAEQVGAVPLDGSKATTNARLPLYNDYCLVYADGQQINLQTRNEAGNDNNRRILRVYNSGQFADIRDALRFVDVTDGTSTAYIIYGTHNKPNASDVGALPKTDGIVPEDVTLKKNTPVLKLVDTTVEAKKSGSGITLEHLPSGRGGMYLLYGNQSYTGVSLNIVETDQTELTGHECQFRVKNSKFDKFFDLFGLHNKPMGSYTGTGTNRTLNICEGTGGNVLFLRIADAQFALVTSCGAIVFTTADTGTIQYYKKSELSFTDGSLHLTSVFNTSGKSYHYQVL